MGKNSREATKIATARQGTEGSYEWYGVKGKFCGHCFEKNTKKYLQNPVV